MNRSHGPADVQPRVSVERVLADGREESSDDPAAVAKGSRDLTRDARLYGLADVAEGASLRVANGREPGLTRQAGHNRGHIQHPWGERPAPPSCSMHPAPS